MTFLPKKHDYFAISFSDSLLQIAQAEPKGKLRFCLSAKLKPGVIERGEIKDPKALRLTLAEVLKSAKLKTKFAVVGLPENLAFIRTFNLPLLSIEETDDAVRWESESLLPLPLDQVYLDWMFLGKNKTQAEVLVVALPQSLVESYARLLEELRIQPIAFEIASLSLSRLAGREKTTVLLIEVQEKEAVAVIVVPGGGIEASSTITFASSSEASTEISATVTNLLNFYRKKFADTRADRKISKILFCGKGTQTGLMNSLKKLSGLPVAAVGQQPNLAVISSLARKEVTPPVDGKTINLIPTRIQGLYDRAMKVNEISLWLRVGLLALFLVFFAYSVTAAWIYFETKKTESRIIDLQVAITPQVKQVEEQANLLNRLAKKIVSIGNLPNNQTAIFSLIRQSAPEGIDVTGCSYADNSNEIIINGRADSRENLLSFRQALQENGKFTQIKVPLSSLEQETNVRFSISVVSN